MSLDNWWQACKKFLRMMASMAEFIYCVCDHFTVPSTSGVGTCGQ